MIHLGDITKINGAEIEPVDVICGGSPCQDLSVAGKRAGLQGERSGLFMEQVRVAKEMRNKDVSTGRTDEFIRPRYMVWENVPGCLSSGQPKGEDFRIVLEELGKIKDENFAVPGCKKWSKAGYIKGNGFSIAWRIMDAQFYGVPQRRRRICVLADFNGYTAGDVLFCEYYRKSGNTDRQPSIVDSSDGCGREVQLERKSLYRNLESCSKTWKGVAEDPQGCLTEHSCTLQIRSGCDGGGKGALIQNEKTGTLSTVQDKTLFK